MALASLALLLFSLQVILAQPLTKVLYQQHSFRPGIKCMLPKSYVGSYGELEALYICLVERYNAEAVGARSSSPKAEAITTSEFKPKKSAAAVADLLVNDNETEEPIQPKRLFFYRPLKRSSGSSVVGQNIESADSPTFAGLEATMNSLMNAFRKVHRTDESGLKQARFGKLTRMARNKAEEEKSTDGKSDVDMVMIPMPRIG